jgi:hypothetical protein
MRGALIDLAFDELSAEHRLSLLLEIENCAECSSQYSEITEALYAVDEAADRARPGEAYWRTYDEALLDRLKQAHGEQRLERAPLWKRFFAARLPVPVPLAALVVLLLIVSTTFSLRTRRSYTAASMPPSPTPAETRVVELPVVHEKVVTRTIYIERKGRQGRAAQSSVARAGEPGLVAREAVEATTPLARTGLAGFQPADDVKLTIIKAREEKKR